MKDEARQVILLLLPELVYSPPYMGTASSLIPANPLNPFEVLIRL